MWRAAMIRIGTGDFIALLRESARERERAKEREREGERGRE
jgi:hypothetical protein